MRKILLIASVLILFAALLLIFTGKTLPRHAVIDGVNCGNLDKKAAAEKIIKTVKAREIPVYKDNKRAGAIAPEYSFDKKALEEKLQKLIKRCRFGLFLRHKMRKGYIVKLNAHSGDVSLIVKKLKDADGNNFTKKTRNAYIDYDKLKIVKETYGDNIDFKKLEKAFKRSVEKQDNVFVYTSSKFYATPTVLSDDEKLTKELSFAKRYLKGGLNLSKEFGDINIPPSRLRSLIAWTDDGARIADEAAESIARWLIKKHSFASKVRVTLLGKEHQFADQGNLLKVDIKKTANSITDAARAKISGKSRLVNIYFTYKDVDFTRNYVLVSIKKQKLYFFKDGKQKMSTPVVTGSFKHFTPKGAFSVMWKERNATLRGREDDGSTYANKVAFWMPITEQGVGLHDAPWRSSFGSDIYKYGGSHGCINMPHAKAKWLYTHITEKYPVFVY